MTDKGWLSPTLTGDKQTDKALLKDYKRQLNRRLKTIYHTNQHTAYAAGRWERIQRTKQMLPYLQYMPSVSANLRDDHKQFYGLIATVEDPIWQSIYPPNGFGCKCWVRQLTKTKAQKLLDEQAEQGIVYDIKMEQFTDPKTGDVISIPKGIAPSFNHNHDRLTALLRLAEDKHGADFAKILGIDLKQEMVGYAKKQGVKVADFTGIVARKDEVARLLIDKLDNKPKLHEAVAGEQYQQYYKVKLERPEPVFIDGDAKAGFDYLVTDTGQTLDFMFTMYGYAQVKIDNLNKFFAHNDDAWNTKRKQILDHLEKSDIVPIDLRSLSVQNAVKLIAFVVSLSKEQQSQIIFITGQP